MDKQPGEVRWERFPKVAALPEAKQWLGIQSMLGLAHNTIEAYGRGLEDFLGWCARAAASRAEGASPRARVPPMDYRDKLPPNLVVHFCSSSGA